MLPFDIIFDIDGTLTDAGHRLHHIIGEERNYDAFYLAAADDPPIVPMMKLLRSLWGNPAHVRCIFLTGRPRRIEPLTRQWFAYYGLEIPRGNLFMREDRDHSKDYDYKFKQLEVIREAGFRPALAFEDSPKVVEMFRAQGICCASLPRDEGTSGDHAAARGGE